MNIIINGKEVPKAELLLLIKKSKLRAVKRLKIFTHIGLKDAKDIIDNLVKNPNYYDGRVIEETIDGFKGDESSTTDLKNAQNEGNSTQKKPIAGSHFLKPNRSSNKLLIFGLIGFALLLIYFFLKDKM
jgi:hypothetical protein